MAIVYAQTRYSRIIKINKLIMWSKLLCSCYYMHVLYRIQLRIKACTWESFPFEIKFGRSQLASIAKKVSQVKFWSLFLKAIYRFFQCSFLILFLLKIWFVYNMTDATDCKKLKKGIKCYEQAWNIMLPFCTFLHKIRKKKITHFASYD